MIGRLAGIIAVFALVVAACGGAATGGEAPATEPTTATTTTTTTTTTRAPSTTTTEVPAFPVTVAADNGDVVVETRPQRIVSLSPTATEMLFALGAGKQVVAVDSYSYYPEEAPVTDLSAFQPNLEAILAYDPDLVVASYDPGDLVAGLEAVGVPVLVLGAASDLDTVYTQIERLGAATGNLAGAAVLAASMRADVEEIVAEAPSFDDPPTFYHEVDPTLYSATSQTFVGGLYALLGLENIADAADEDGYGYPQLSAEYIIEADPDFVFLADTKCCGQNADTVAQRPGWDQLTAVREGRVVELDDDIASRWGPRIVDFLRVVVDAVARLVPADA